MEALAILSRLNSQLTNDQQNASRLDNLQPRVIAEVEFTKADEMFVTINCGGVPERYDSSTVIILHTKRNLEVPGAPENELLNRMSTWPNVDLNNALLSYVDEFIIRIPRFYDTATRATMFTNRKGVTDFTFEEERERVPYYPDESSLPKRVRSALIKDLLKYKSLGPFTDIVTWRGERHVFCRTREDSEAFVRHVGLLSKKLSKHYVAMSVIVIDAKELLRGYIIPYYSLGNLSDVFLGTGTARPSFSLDDLPLKLKWSQALAQALADAHASSITLGNLSPHHVLVTNAGDIVVDDLSGVVTKDSRGWAAPEVQSAREGERFATTASDVYSLGAVLWALGLGSADASCWTTSPRTSQERWTGANMVPEWFRQIVDRCLEIDPANRPRAVEVRDALLHEVK